MNIYQSDVNATVVSTMKVLFICFFCILSFKLNFKISILLGAPGLQSPYLPITVGPLEVEIVEIEFFPLWIFILEFLSKLQNIKAGQISK